MILETRLVSINMKPDGQLVGRVQLEILTVISFFPRFLFYAVA